MPTLPHATCGVDFLVKRSLENACSPLIVGDVALDVLGVKCPTEACVLGRIVQCPDDSLLDIGPSTLDGGCVVVVHKHAPVLEFTPGAEIIGAACPETLVPVFTAGWRVDLAGTARHGGDEA